MHNIENSTVPKRLAKPIGGWLWVIMLMMIASALSMIIGIVTTTSELFSDDWSQYFQATDELLKVRVNIYGYLIISNIVGLVLLVWCLIVFFKKKHNFPAVFLGVLGYFILMEVLRVYFLDYYMGLTGQDTNYIESGLLKTGIVAILAGLYLNKGKRPNQTFVN
ncbi:hypothetical protein GCM10011506_38250 [Marivirga lumbricoides]|uniref:DUF2569 domain-containing protein n=1 Tax=Marivirga lumbricoides TaxID=1046115 RepID=A0ABQ1MXL9_9BACT|nr:hypothetical protein GCM10011506_38250 [Marivirga lumbricoides]